MKTHRIRHLLLVLTAIAIGSLAGTAAYAADEAVTAYDISVTLRPETTSLAGVQRTDYVNDTDETLSEVYFSLIANWGAQPNPHIAPALADASYDHGFDPTWTHIESVTDQNGDPLLFRLESVPPAIQTFSLEDGLLVVELPAPLAPGDSIHLEIAFETKFAAGVLGDNAVYRDTYVWRFGWNPIAVSAAARSGQFALPAADYRVELTVPEDFTALGGADRQSETASEDGLITHLLESDHPTRSVPLIIGKDLATVSSTWNGVELEAAYAPGGETFARLALTYAAEILASHAERFGPYTGSRIIIAENPTPGFFGMAADGMILAGSSFAALKDMPALGAYDRVAEYLLAHELAHLWWGIGIGTDFNAENWISEGFAEYLSIGYFEDKYGAFEPNLFAHLENGLVEDVLAEILGYYNLRQHMSEAPYLDLVKLGFDEAIVQPMSDVNYVNGQTVRTYNKGYLVLRALEGSLGRDRMEEILQQAREEWIGRTMTVSDFVSIVEQHAGHDLQPGFFEDWLYSDTQIDVGIDGFLVDETETGYQPTLTLRRSGSDLSATIEMTLADGTVESFDWVSHDSDEPFTLHPNETASPVVAVSIDPYEMLPDTNRFNNHWPRKILVEHPFQAEDAEPAGRPLDAYVVQVSTSSISGFFRNDHQWSLAVMPHIDEDLDFEAVELEEFALTWDVIGLFAANIDRNLSILVQGSATDVDCMTGTGELDLLATANVRFFTNPETGNAGTYWYPANQLNLSIGAIGDLKLPVPYATVALTGSGLPARLLSGTAKLTLGIPGFGTPSFASLQVGGDWRLRMAPLFYLDLQATAGKTLVGDLPEPFAFALDRLYAFEDLPQGDRQVDGGIEIIFPPLARNTGYAIFNLTRIDTITASVFVQGGKIWSDSLAPCDPGLLAEAGAKFTISVAGLFGGPVELSFGYAHPLLGPATEGVPFIGFGSAF